MSSEGFYELFIAEKQQTARAKGRFSPSPPPSPGVGGGGARLVPGDIGPAARLPTWVAA